MVKSMESVVEKRRPGEMRATGGESTAAEPSRASTDHRARKMATDHAMSNATAPDHRVSRASTHAAAGAGISHSGSSAKDSCSCKYDDYFTHHFLLIILDCHNTITRDLVNHV